MIRICVVSALLAMIGTAVPAATANGGIGFTSVASEPHGRYGGIEYVRYTGTFQGLASGAYEVAFEIVAPADPSRGNGAVLLEPSYVGLSLARDGYLTADFLYNRRFSYATVGWHDPAINPMGGQPFSVDEAIEILTNFLTALRTDPQAQAMVGDVRGLYAIGASMTTRPLKALHESPGAPLLDFTFLTVPGWEADTYTPNPAANKIMVFLTEADIVGSVMYGGNVQAFRTNAPNYRYYEVAGGQHVPDTPWVRMVLGGMGVDMTGVNPLNWTLNVRALFMAGHRWARWGALPPPSVQLAAAPAGEFDPVYQAEYGLDLETGIARDENGNALGGIRMPDLAIGRGQYIGHDVDNPYGWFGKWYDLKCEPLPGGGVRFESHRAYTRAFRRQVARLGMQGYLLGVDAWRLMGNAYRSDVGRPGACPP
jgi:hypothetical protein